MSERMTDWVGMGAQAPQAWRQAVNYSLDEWEIERLTNKHGLQHLANRAIAILHDQRDHPEWWMAP
jgi:hypothetical protein